MPDPKFLKTVRDEAMRDYAAQANVANAEFVQAELTGNHLAAAAAAQKLAAISIHVAELNRMGDVAEAAVQNGPQPNKFGLSDAQVEHARICGVTEEEYARHVPELERRKKAGMYPDR